jgi:hypothetical protein
MLTDLFEYSLRKVEDVSGSLPLWCLTAATAGTAVVRWRRDTAATTSAVAALSPAPQAGGETPPLQDNECRKRRPEGYRARAGVGKAVDGAVADLA